MFEFMENHEFIYEFMKKNMNLGAPRGIPSKNSYIWIHIWFYIHIWIPIYEFRYENKFYKFIYEFKYELIYVITQDIHKWIHNITWWSGCSKYGKRWLRLRLLLSSGGRLLQVKAGSGTIQVGMTRAARVTWAAAIEAGCSEWQRAAASDWSSTVTASGGWRRAAGRSEWRRVAASDSGCGEWGELWRVMDGGPLLVTLARAGASEPGWPLRVTAGRAAARWVTWVTVSYTGCVSDAGHGSRVTAGSASDSGRSEWRRGVASIFGKKALQNLCVSHKAV